MRRRALVSPSPILRRSTSTHGVALVHSILWPFGGDQPLNAVHISEQLKVGYELIEVRTGPAGLHTIRRNGRTPVGTIEAIKSEVSDVLAKAYGPDGAEKRERLATLTHAVTHEWEEGGGALRDVTAFLDAL